jgi:tetratricopeptide (TPR) repeat protein
VFFGSREDDAKTLHDEALAAIDRGEHAAARAIAARLRDMRWSGAFEIEALAARREGDLETALRALDEGTSLAPGAWLLHQLRGITLDDLGRHADAVAAFDAGLRCEGAWTASLRWNRAIARERSGDTGGALADAESVLEDPSAAPFVLDALRLAIDALAALKRTDHAIRLVRTFASAIPAEQGQARAQLAAFEALALVRAGAAQEEVLAKCDEAIEGWASRREVGDALAAIAGGADVDSCWRITISGPRPPDVDPDVEGYFRSVEVRAATEADARALACRLEPSSVRAALEVERCEPLEPRRGKPGVVAAHGRVFYGGRGPQP